MHKTTENLRNSTRDARLYCVWVRVHDDGRDRLLAVWIDRALTAFESCTPETSEGTGTATSRFRGHREEEVDLFPGEDLTSILPRRS